MALFRMRSSTPRMEAGAPPQMWLQTEGLHAVVVTDRDGVPILKECNELTPELSTRPGFLSTFSILTEQGGKLGLGKNNRVVCIYDNFQVINFNKETIMIILIASTSANIGALMNMEEKLNDVVCDLKAALDITTT
ncbi:Ragulator complex protein LAMTOR3-B [Nymphon striatum]|nr:Ragulator complex protein LAMTOR3-B [Nymphon striatum]